MENILARFPHLGKLVFNNIDNQSVINLKEASRDVSEFMEIDRFFWIRILKKYGKNFDKFKESWKEVTKKTPLEKVKQIGMAVKTFFQAYPLIETLESTQIAPIHIATEQNNVELCEFIYEKATLKNPEATLQLAITFDNKIDIYKYPTLKGGNGVEFGLTPLHIAALKGNLDLFKLIFVNAIEKNPADERDKLTPLHMAAQNGHFEICKHIIENVKDKNPPDRGGKTPFHSAAANGHLEICKLMIKNDVDISYVGVSPLHLAALNGHLEICMIIIENMEEKTPIENHVFIQWWHLKGHTQVKVGYFRS